jgi:fucose 4-O-acetylase-like acetyltransferase
MDQRIEWIDIAKGFGIFLVVAGHLMNGGESFVSRWICSFHMPLFFFLSGICLNNNRSFGSYAGKKAKSLLLPYLGFGILLTFLYLGLKPLDEIHDGIVTRLFNYGAMWFIPVLFVTELMFFYISKIRKRLLICGIMTLSIFIGWLLYYFRISLPIALSTCFAALFFYGLGFLGKNFVKKLFNKTLLLPAFLVAQFAAILLSHSTIGMSSNSMPQPFYNVSAAIFGLLTFCMICKVLINRVLWGGWV